MEKTNILKISPYSKIKIYWDDRPENYNREAKNKIKSLAAKKYGVNKNNIDVIYRPVKISDNGDVIEINGATIENIMDVSYQRELMREWIKRENKNVDFNRILKLDDKVNAELNIENDDIQHKSWSIKWLMVDNFLSFGEDNFVSFSKLKGLNIVNSLPSNQGGKTTLTIDAIKFLLHGSTTKTDKNEEVFNQFSDRNDLVVRGMIEISEREVIIERKMKRTAKKGGGWTVVNKVNYYELLPDGEEVELNEEDAKRTTAKLRSTIGSEKDFEMLVLATEKNLDDLVGLTTTESGKILTRLIGLEVIEMKEAVVRKMYNEFDKKKKSNLYNIVDLKMSISEHEENINTAKNVRQSLNTKLSENEKSKIDLTQKHDNFLSSKAQVDVSINTLNPSKLEDEISIITEKGKKLVKRVSELEQDILNIGDCEFNEDLHYKLTNTKNDLEVKIKVNNNEIDRLKRSISDLIDSGICKSCNRKLDDVDNTEHIKKHEDSLEETNNDNEKIKKELDIVEYKLVKLNEQKINFDLKNKLELEKDKIEVEIGSLRNEVVSKKNDLKKYKLNQEAIELNRKIDSEVSMIKTKINVADSERDTIIKNLERVGQDIQVNENDIITKTNLIAQIEKENEIEKVYKIYIDLVGKKGISKLVLRSVLPIINSEVYRLLEDVCDFEVEIFIDDKNDVQFLLNKDGISKPLKSGSGFEKTAASLALRAVLGKLSTLPMPNFITFDEVLGKVANENIEKLKPLFDKIKDMYEIVFLITHNDIIKDWSTNIITVIKTNNISKLSVKK